MLYCGSASAGPKLGDASLTQADLEKAEFEKKAAYETTLAGRDAKTWVFRDSPGVLRLWFGFRAFWGR